MRSLSQHQRGVALLTALLVVALASVIAYGLLQAADRGLTGAQAGARGLQARLVARGLEEFAMSALLRDEAVSPGVDALGEAWAGALPPLPFERGFVLAQLSDLDGKLNINALVREDGSVDPLVQKRFLRLLERQRLPTALLPAMIDWIDADSLSSSGGAEDADYLRLNPAIRCPNRALTDISELSGLNGLDADTQRVLLRWVTAIPRSSPLNLNTAPWEVLDAIIPGLDETKLQALRPTGAAWRTIDDVRGALAALNLSLPQGEELNLGFSSRWFIATATVELDGAAYQFQTLLERAPGVLAVRWRQRGAVY
jgi:general secretion pathway protein K